MASSTPFRSAASCLCLQATRRGPPLSPPPPPPHPNPKHGSEKRAGNRFFHNTAVGRIPPRCRSVSETPLHPPAAPPLASYLIPTHPPTLPPLPRNMAERHAHSPTYRVTKSFPGVGWRGLRYHFSASQDGFGFFSFYGFLRPPPSSSSSLPGNREQGQVSRALPPPPLTLSPLLPALAPPSSPTHPPTRNMAER